MAWRRAHVASHLPVDQVGGTHDRTVARILNITRFLRGAAEERRKRPDKRRPPPDRRVSSAPPGVRTVGADPPPSLSPSHSLSLSRNQSSPASSARRELICRLRHKPPPRLRSPSTRGCARLVPVARLLPPRTEWRLSRAARLLLASSSSSSSVISTSPSLSPPPLLLLLSLL